MNLPKKPSASPPHSANPLRKPEKIAIGPPKSSATGQTWRNLLKSDVDKYAAEHESPSLFKRITDRLFGDKKS